MSGHREAIVPRIGWAGSWTELSSANSPIRSIDYGSRFGLIGATLLEARCDIVEPRETTCLTLTFDRGALRLSYARPNDLDGDVVLTFEPRGER